MTVYSTNIPDIAAFDFYRYNAAGVDSEPLLPAAGVTLGFPSGTQVGEVIIYAGSSGTGVTSPTVSVVGGAEDGINYLFTSGTAANASSFTFRWHVVKASETGLFVQFLSGGVTPIASPAAIWIIRIDGSTNPAIDLDGPRYQYWNGSADLTLRGIETPSGGGDTIFDPQAIETGDSSLLAAAPGGIAAVQARWFQGLDMNTTYTGTDPDQEDYAADVLTLPSTPSGWTLMDDSVYFTGVLVNTVAVYHRAENAESVTFPAVTLPVDDYAGAGGLVHFLDYDYDAVGSYLGFLGATA